VQRAVAIFDSRNMVAFVLHAGNEFRFSSVPPLALSRDSMWYTCMPGPVIKHAFT